MKKLFIIFFLITGCAHTQTYVPPADLVAHLERVNIEVSRCIKPKNNLTFYIAKSNDINAWLYDDRIYFTEGLFKLDDDTLRFIMAHEIAHDKLGHFQERKNTSTVTTGVMMVLNVLIPGAGVLNWIANPAVVNHYSKIQEFEADSEASKACVCMGISIKRQIEVLRELQRLTLDGGGFWDKHPSWDERIENINGYNK